MSDSAMNFTFSGGVEKMMAPNKFLSNIAYNRPDTMILGESTNITLVIGKAGIYNMEELIENEFTRNDHLRTETKELSKEIGAILIGSNFEINPDCEIRQILTDEKMCWEWSIKPLSCGSHTLSLIIYKYIEELGKESQQQLKAMKDNIYIYVPKTPWNKQLLTFFLDHLEWLFTLIVIPVIVSFRKKIIQYFKSRRS